MTSKSTIKFGFTDNQLWQILGWYNCVCHECLEDGNDRQVANKIEKELIRRD